jgi:hypothetical protein
VSHVDAVLWATRFVCGLGVLLVIGWLWEHRWW